MRETKRIIYKKKRRSWFWRLIGRNPALMLMLAIALPGLIISVLGAVSLGHQQLAREIALKEKWLGSLQQMKASLQAAADAEIRAVLEDLGRLDGDAIRADGLPAAMRSLLAKHAIVQYPFVIDQQGQFLFPLAKAMTALADVTLQTSFSLPRLQELFRDGEGQELDKRDWLGAIRIYLQGLALAREPRDKATFGYALGRCYYKWGKYAQAIAYLRELTAGPDTGFGQNSLLRFAIWQQLALALHQNQQPDEAAYCYQQLYESILAYETPASSGALAYYKEEALRYLKRRIIKSDTLASRAPAAKTVPTLPTEGDMDPFGRWSFFEAPQTNQAADNGQSEARLRARLAQIQDFYLDRDEKTQFYDRVQSAMGFTSDPAMATFLQGASDQSYHHPRLGAVFFKSQGLVMGFHILGTHLDQTIFAQVAEESWSQAGTRVKLQSLAAVNEAKDNEFVLLRLPLEKGFMGKELLLLGPHADHISRLARRDLQINYALIISQLLTLMVALWFIFRYLRREGRWLEQKGRFMETAAHTLKSPLARIRLLSESLHLNWLDSEAKRQDYLGKIIFQTERMNEMVGNLLDFSRIEAGAKTYCLRVESLAHVARDTMKELEPMLESDGVHSEITIDETMPALAFDPLALRLILHNLVQNAIKYSLGEKWLSLRIFTSGQEACIEVADHGLGIERVHFKRLFEKFYRVDSPSIHPIEGSGLGLYLVWHGVMAHGGRVEVRSEPGQGSVFSVYIPLNNSEGVR